LSKPSNPALTHRIIDANINRAKEGLRVCEEIVRFILNSAGLTSQFKQIRHRIDLLSKRIASRALLIKERHSLSDVGQDIYANELKRKDIPDIFFANIQRVKESVRVLEEFSKLKDIKIALELKKLRYRIYELEKKVTNRIITTIK
jgi:thiamine-phosphate pyrophosphorylase